MTSQKLKRLVAIALAERMSAIGKAGGSKKGPTKRRGHSGYYSELARKAWAKSKEKREA